MSQGPPGAGEWTDQTISLAAKKRRWRAMPLDRNRRAGWDSTHMGSAVICDLCDCLPALPLRSSGAGWPMR